jgi:hypothetical protein
MEHVFKMRVTDLGSFLLREEVVETMEGMRACQAYGKALGEMIRA